MQNKPGWKEIVGLAVFMLVMRLLPHPWNFTPVLAGSLYLGASLPGRAALLAALTPMLLADALIGFHSSMPFVYLSLALIVLAGRFLRQTSLSRTLAGGLAASVVFFFISNFGVWLATPLYVKTLAGLLTCLVAALPFFHNTLASTLIFTPLIFAAHRLLQTRWRWQSMILN